MSHVHAVESTRFVSAIVMIAVSYASEAPAYDKISELTYATKTEEDKKVSRASWNVTDVLLSIVVMILILGAYIYFTG
ncbi:MAG: hypothetical protein HY088_04510 [Ignavibacteriales bacterium]|nr:hypothetical protein [Ignavibacteriales bacterium]